MLQKLYKQNIPFFIGTNKRYIPTMKILDHYSWDNLFKNVYAIDRFNKPYKNKTQLLKNLIQNENIPTEKTLYIGD